MTYLFKDKIAKHLILTRDKPERDEAIAYCELSEFLYQSCGGTIAMLTESDYVRGRFISLGETAAFRRSGIEFDREKLGPCGYIVKTADGNVYIVGGGAIGTLYGVYEFLRRIIGFEVFGKDEIRFLKAADIEFKDLDIVGIPDFKYRIGNTYDMLKRQTAYSRRLRVETESEVFLRATPNIYHNSFEYFPPDIYKGGHPEWYSEWDGVTYNVGDPKKYAPGKQLCYTARGNAAALDEMAGVAAGKIIPAVKTGGSDNAYVSLTHQDSANWCTCAACRHLEKKYGTKAAGPLMFCNLVSKKVKAGLCGFNKERVKAGLSERKAEICFFAYLMTEKPPVKETAGGYEPIDDAVICDENVFVWYAPVSSEFTTGFTSGPEWTVAAGKNMKAWNAVSKKLFLWTYQTNFSYYLSFYNSIASMGERYRFMRDCGAECLFDQCQGVPGQVTGFHNLKAWLSAKLMWNADSDVEALTAAYFDGYFYGAAKTMRGLYEGITKHFASLEASGKMTGSIYFEIDKAELFPKNVLEAWLSQIERAYADIEKYKGDGVLHKRLNERICAESVFIRYLLIQLYGECYPELSGMKNGFKLDCERMSITNFTENKELPETLWKEWGI
ncbi:MAG: DUF4838 domain-containing protein [Clostridiales bacterium]|jgi:hypothetical protein|nr:DUF4838 domain-containing protein [Clostridiales bacterium]